MRDLQDAARAIGLQLHVLQASNDREIETAFESVPLHRIPALAVAADPFFNSRRDKLFALAARYRCRRSVRFATMFVAGGLISYGATFPMPIAKSASMPAAFSRARRRPICRW